MTDPSNELRYEEYLAISHRPAFDGMRGIGFLMSREIRGLGEIEQIDCSYDYHRYKR